jgi:hypothetical protein
MPLSVSGSSVVVSNALRARSSVSGVVSSCPGFALPISRAASAAVVPRMVYVRRNSAPTSPEKTRPAAHPEPQRKRRLEVGDAARGADDALLVLALGLGRPGDEDDLAAVAVDVGLEERHAVLVGHLLRTRDERLERVRELVRPARFEHLVDTAEVDERRTAAWRCSGSARPDSTWRRTGPGTQAARSRPSAGRQELDPLRGPGRRLQQEPALLLVAQDPLGQRRRGLLADEDLAGLGAGLPSRPPGSPRARSGAARGADSPTRKKSKTSLWMPTCIFSVTGPADVRGRPSSRSALRIP